MLFRGRLPAYERYRIAQQHKAWSMVRQLFGETLHICIDVSIHWPDLQCLLVNLV